MAANETSAQTMVNKWLAAYGLTSLAQWAFEKIKNNVSADQIYIEMRDTPEYKARFPAMANLAQQGRAISEDAYIEYERTVAQALQRYQITSGIYDTPASIAKLLTNNVSAVEVGDRLQMASSAALEAPAEVRTSLAQNYNVNLGDMTAYYLDPDRAMPKLQAQYNAAQVQAASRMQGIGQTIATAERLAAQGVTYEQAMSGFGTAQNLRGVTTGYGETASQAELVDAAFGAATSQQKLRRIQASRAASYQAGGGAAENQTGVTGLGSAATT